MENIPVPVLIFFCLFWSMCLFCILKPGLVVNLTAKYFKWSIGLYGFEADIKVTPKAKTICRIWNLVLLLITLAGVLMILFGKPK